MEERIAQLEMELAELKEVYYKDNFIGKQTFRKTVDFEKDVTMEGLRATSFGLGVTPAVQQVNIVAPTGGTTVDTQARTAINSILSVLDTFGFTA